MKQSRLLIPTLREAPSERMTISHQLLIQAGFIRQTTKGSYAYLPLAHRVIEKIKRIIQEEFKKIDVMEMTLPTLVASELWENSRESEKSDIFRLKDSSQQEYLLGVSHEEELTELIHAEVSSSEQLPLSLYQIQMKLLDNEQPYCGLLHSREFINCEVYSFHESEESLEGQYRQFERAYREILKRCELECISVLGKDSYLNQDTREFIVLSDCGDKTICVSTESDYAANLEMATSLYTSKKSHATYLELEKVATPNQKTIQEVAHFLDVTLQKMIKSYFYMIDNQPILVLLRGDHQLNLVKLQNYLEIEKLREGTEVEAKQFFNASFTSISPIGASPEVKIYADLYVQDLVNAVVRSNEVGYYFIHVNPNRDFHPEAYADFRLVQKGDISPDGFGELVFHQGIELGRLLKVGSYFSEKIGATVANNEHQQVPVLMGRFQIGVSRLMATIVESHSDETGIFWPKEIAPFDIHLLQMDMEDDYQQSLVKEIHEAMIALGYEVLIDDREEQLEIKLAEADLIGCPIRITIGKKATDGIVEIKIKKTGAMLEVRKEELASTLRILLNEE